MTSLQGSAIRAVFFDAVGTLIYPSPSVGEVYARVGRRHGVELTPDIIERRFRTAFQQQEELDVQRGQRTSEERERERWRSIVAEVFHDQPDPTAPLQELWDHFALPTSWACYPEVRGSLEALSRRGLALGIASNFDGRLRSVVAGLPELRWCDSLVISSEVGWRKPAPPFFHALIERARTPAAQIMLVGDDLVSDYQGGRDAGLATVLVVRQPGQVAGTTISSLTELAPPTLPLPE